MRDHRENIDDDAHRDGSISSAANHEETVLAAESEASKNEAAKNEAAESGEDDPSAIRNGAYDSLVLVCNYFGLNADSRYLAGEFSPRISVSCRDLVRAARSVGLKAREARVALDRLATTPFPLIGIDVHGVFFVLAKVENGSCVVVRGGKPPDIVAVSDLADIWDGQSILLTRRDSLEEAIRKFDLTWFIPTVMKYRRIMAEILIVSAFLQVFAIVTPLMFQIIIDRVLAEQQMGTLYVVTGTLVIVSFMEVILGGLRSIALAHTASRIDAELGGRLFSHLLRLPLAYFQFQPSGQTAARVLELENIREFLTGNALNAMIDVIFIFVLFIAMSFWSPLLTLVVAAIIPLCILVAVIVTPILKRRVDIKFRRHASSHSFLIESISGMETIKSLAIAPPRIDEWHNRLAAHVAANLNVVAVGTWGGQAFMVISKIMLIGVLFFGAQEVIAGALTVGSLVAFNMLAQQVAAPILRMSNLWQDFQEMRLSVERLGDILNSPVEPRPKSTEAPKQISGEVRFESLSFSYPGQGRPVVDSMNCVVKPGEIVGVVGPSGCGKSTLMRLLQRLYTPDSGRVLLDGLDIALMDPDWLRRRVGIVLQESYLFNDTVRRNIAQCDPSAPLEAVIDAAKLSGIHDFIVGLPMGYDTMLEERGQNLSGGQRQRMAIARALVGTVSILIMDEATSALDYESELHIQQAMRRIAENRTVFIVAHRLSALRPCTRILTLDSGRVVQDGTPRDLLAQDGFFRKLCQSQMFQEPAT